MVINATLFATLEVTVADPTKYMKWENAFNYIGHIPKPELRWVNFDESCSCFPLKRRDVMSPLLLLTGKSQWQNNLRGLFFSLVVTRPAPESTTKFEPEVLTPKAAKAAGMKVRRVTAKAWSFICAHNSGCRDGRFYTLAASYYFPSSSASLCLLMSSLVTWAPSTCNLHVDIGDERKGNAKARQEALAGYSPSRRRKRHDCVTLAFGNRRTASDSAQ